MSYNNRLALVTGASAGLGVDFARQLAEAGCDLVLVARRQENLERLADEIEQGTGRRPVVRPCDLSSAEERQKVAQDFPEVDILINNAGVGVFGRFADSEWDRVAQMVEVDIAALTHLTHLFLPGMKERKWGRILQVASTAAFQPCPSLASYAASKSYVLNFSLALDHELKGSGVVSSCLCPGATATEFVEVSGQQLSDFMRRSQMTSPEVVEIGLKGLEQGRPYVIAGRMNAFLAFSTRFMPVGLVTAISDFILRPPTVAVAR